MEDDVVNLSYVFKRNFLGESTATKSSSDMVVWGDGIVENK